MRFTEFRPLEEKLGPVTAVPGKVPTKDKIDDGTLRVGPPYPPDKKDEVSAMQADLKKLGYDIGSTGVDGKFGPRTRAAVDAFKKDYKISGDGSTFSPEDTQKLSDVISGKIPKVPPSLVAAPKGQAGSFGVPVPVPGSNDAKAIRRVVDAGPGYTDVQTVDGEILRRQGVRNWRNNNPGNLEYGPFARSKGAVGTDGRFAVFPSLEAGMKAKEDLVFGKNYIDLSIYNAIAKYAPESENDVRMYVGQVTQATGASPDTRLRDLTSAQRKAMLDTITRVEGFRTGQVVALGKTGTATA